MRSFCRCNLLFTRVSVALARIHTVWCSRPAAAVRTLPFVVTCYLRLSLGGSAFASGPALFYLVAPVR